MHNSLELIGFTFDINRTITINMLRKIKKQSMKVLLCYALFFSCSHTQTPPNIHVTNNEFPTFDVQKKVLPNGLTLLFVQKNKVPVFSFFNFIKVGSHYETPGITGAAHFLEHLMFQGGKQFPAGAFDSVMASNGGSSNATTDYDLTTYFENLPISAIDTILKMEEDRLKNLAFDSEAFEKERNVILEERKMRLENSPQGQIFNETLKNMYKGTPYEHSIIGSVEDLTAVTKDQIHQFFNTYYVPNNMVMVIVGDFTSSDIFTKWEKVFGSLVKNEKLDQIKAAFDDPALYQSDLKLKRLHIKGHSKNPMFYFAIQGYPSTHRLATITELLSVMMGYGKSSFLHQSFVSGRKPSLSQVQSFHYALKNAGLFIISGTLLQGKKIDQVEKELRAGLPQFCNEVITSRNVTKTKNQYLVSYYEGLQKTAEIAQLLGKYEAYSGDFNDYRKEVELINEVKIEEIRSVCNSLIQHPKNLFVSLWDQN